MKGSRIVDRMLGIDRVHEEALARSAPATRIDDVAIAVEVRMQGDDDLLAWVTQSVLRAERSGRQADWRVVSLAEEELARRHANSETLVADTGRVGAITAALEAGDPDRAESLALRFRSDSDSPAVRAMLVDLRWAARLDILVRGRSAL